MHLLSSLGTAINTDARSPSMPAPIIRAFVSAAQASCERFLSTCFYNRLTHATTSRSDRIPHATLVQTRNVHKPVLIKPRFNIVGYMSDDRTLDPNTAVTPCLTLPRRTPDISGWPFR